MIPPGEPCCSSKFVMEAVTMLSFSLLSKSTPTLKGRCRAEIKNIKKKMHNWTTTVEDGKEAVRTNMHTTVCLYLPQTVPATIEASAESEPVVEAKTLPHRRPPLV